MKKAILGKKIGMTQVFTEDGQLIPVSVIQAGPCQVVQKKTEEVDGYTAVQVGYEDKKERRANKPEKGHFQKANVPVKKYLKEFKLDNAAELNVGDDLQLNSLQTETFWTLPEQAKVMVSQVQSRDGEHTEVL